jgi:hypothetical protein
MAGYNFMQLVQPPPTVGTANVTGSPTVSTTRR